MKNRREEDCKEKRREEKRENPNLEVMTVNKPQRSSFKRLPMNV